jgi:hypothetical protein
MNCVLYEFKVYYRHKNNYLRKCDYINPEVYDTCISIIHNKNKNSIRFILESIMNINRNIIRKYFI